jgi:hypothetical protein
MLAVIVLPMRRTPFCLTRASTSYFISHSSFLIFYSSHKNRLSRSLLLCKCSNWMKSTIRNYTGTGTGRGRGTAIKQDTLYAPRPTVLTGRHPIGCSMRTKLLIANVLVRYVNSSCRFYYCIVLFRRAFLASSMDDTQVNRSVHITSPHFILIHLTDFICQQHMVFF